MLILAKLSSLEIIFRVTFLSRRSPIHALFWEKIKLYKTLQKQKITKFYKNLQKQKIKTLVV